MILIVKVKKYSIFLSLRKDLLVCMVRTGRTCAYCERNSNRPAAEKREDTLFKLNTMIEIIMQNEEKWKGSLVFWRRSYYKRRLDSRSERGEPLYGCRRMGALAVSRWTRSCGSAFEDARRSKAVYRAVLLHLIDHKKSVPASGMVEQRATWSTEDFLHHRDAISDRTVTR